MDPLVNPLYDVMCILFMTHVHEKWNTFQNMCITFYDIMYMLAFDKKTLHIDGLNFFWAS